jgi:hypothetical protein
MCKGKVQPMWNSLTSKYILILKSQVKKNADKDWKKLAVTWGSYKKNIH